MGSVSSEDGFDQQSEQCGSYSLSADVSESESCSSFSCRRCDAEGASSSMTSSPRPGIGNFCFPVPLSVMLPVIGGRDVMVWDEKPEKQEADFSGKKMSTFQARPKPKPKQGKSFSVEEDEALCIAWLTISQDPVTGSGQPLAKFWDRVLLHFVSKNVCQGPRTSCSIQCRWAQIRHFCTKYRGCLAQIQHRPAKSGSNLLDEVVQAKKLFENDFGKPFHLDHCWEILKCCDKWIIVEAPTLPHSSPMKNKRPPGPKTEKESRRKNNASPANSSSAFIDTMRDVLAQKEMRRVLFEEEKLGFMKAASDREVLQLQLARAAEERMRATEERMRATEERKKAADDREQRREDEAIMKIDITGMSPDLQYYYQLQKNAIMAKALQKGCSSNFSPLLDS